MAREHRIITVDGIRYLPIALAAEMSQVPRQTLLNWIKNETKIGGRKLQGYYLDPAQMFFVSEESAQRVANRFVRWPSGEPAGHVTMGETDDKSGFLGLPEASRIIGVSRQTIWIWVTKGGAPLKSLDVIKCSASEQFYIREKHISELKDLIPKSRGRRRQTAPAP